MKSKFVIFVLIFMLSAFMLVGCKSDQDTQPAEGPEGVYWTYYNACQGKHFDVASQYLTSAALERANAIGVCGFTHDAINDLIALQGGTMRTFSGEPEVFMDETTANLTWFDDQGNVANVTLTQTEEGWKIVQSMWSN
jgi:hypothetical protein